MRVGLIAVSYQPIKRTAVGGTEVFTTLLAEGLVRRGHQVWLFAGADSKVKGVHLVPTAPAAYVRLSEIIYHRPAQALTQVERERLLSCLTTSSLIKAKAYEKTIDVFHDNTSSALAGVLSSTFRRPFISTLHLPPTSHDFYFHIPRFITRPRVHYVAVSRYQQARFLGRSSVIYNGIDVESFPWQSRSDQIGLRWIGRIDSNTPKGLDDALRVAKTERCPLQWAGFIEQQDYFDKTIRPLLSRYARRDEGLMTMTKKAAWYASGRASLLPIQWEEPFGLVAAESLAAGTPVIGYARGAFPEVIEDGVTGFLVNPSVRDHRGHWVIKQTGVAGLRAAVRRLNTMPSNEYAAMRLACRQRVEHQFSIDHMVEHYEQLYRRLITKAKRHG
ncbi:MAG: glycosyl transferase, group 1 [uncultured bacterium]|nr:MAG: glycosyl transferase, group 1 [uncultured bacterium]HBY74051.1 hypothetical protein [Candidatus Kerfeldbacteria bacterium]